MTEEAVAALSYKLDRQFTWRAKEISNLFTNTERSRDAFQGSLQRAFVCILYAHWEGFVKDVACEYVSFVLRFTHRLADLRPNFVALQLYGRMRGIAANSHVAAYASVFEDAVRSFEDTLRCDPRTVIDTQSNLSYDVLKKIYVACGICFGSGWDVRRSFIDDILLGRRNRIAHGAYVEVTSSEIGEMKEQTVEMMGWVRSDFENAFALHSFLR